MEGQSDSPSKICEFYKESKCRFGSECHNLHEGPVNSAKISTKKSKKSTSAAKIEVEKSSPKSMKTALDVIKRIQWDEMLPAELFTIGYLDRFTGIQEDEFSKFSNWGDIAGAEYDDLAIPQHRIEYFKYKGTIVWDKKSRLDLVFGSSGDNHGKTIIDVMYEIDDRIKNQTFKPSLFYLERNNKIKSYYYKNQNRILKECEKEGSEDETDEDEEEDFDFQVNIDPNLQFICRFPEELRSTHFIAIRITDPDIIRTAKSIQENIVSKEEALNDCCMGIGLFHVTLYMLRLESHEGTKELIDALEALKPKISEICQNLKLSISGLDTFGQRVLYGKVLPDPEENFWQLASLIRDTIAHSSVNVKVTDKFELRPHMTLIKVNRPIARFRKSKYLPSALYESHVNDHFGIQPVDNLQLCILESTTRFDGFYSTLTEMKF